MFILLVSAGLGVPCGEEGARVFWEDSGSAPWYLTSGRGGAPKLGEIPPRRARSA